MIAPELQRLMVEGMRLHPLRFNSKLPLLAKWQERASSNPDQIEQWSKEFADCGWGLATGAGSNCWVLDVDGQEGLDSLKQLCKRYGKESFTTRTVRTRRGFHLYFRWNDDQPIRNSAGQLAAGLDTRGEGGYVVAPGSTVGGHTYTMSDTPIIAATFVDLFNEMLPTTEAAADGNDAIPLHQRNVTLTSLAGSMRAKGFTQEAIEAALLAENAARCQPPLPEEDVYRIARSIARYEPGMTVIMPEPVKDAFRTIQQACNVRLEGTEYLIDGLLPAKAKVYCTGKPKVGKTTITFDQLRELSVGGAWCGFPCRKISWVYLSEQGEASFVEQAREAGIDKLGESYVLYRPDVIGRPWEEIAREAIAKCMEIGARLLVVDTLAAWSGVTEQNSSQAALAWNALEPAPGQGVTVLALAHARKGEVEDVADAISGHNAQAGRADAIFWLHRAPGRQEKRSYRILEYRGRFSGIPETLCFDYVDQRYTMIGGDEIAVAMMACRKALRQILPSDQARALPMEELLAVTKAKRTTMRRCLAESWVAKTGTGHKGDPLRYFLANAAILANTNETVGQNLCQHLCQAADSGQYSSSLPGNTGTPVREDGFGQDPCGLAGELAKEFSDDDHTPDADWELGQ